MRTKAVLFLTTLLIPALPVIGQEKGADSGVYKVEFNIHDGSDAAAKTGRSKGALVREALRRQVKPLPPLEQDPLWELAGAASFEPVPPDKIDDVVYDGR